MIDISKIFGAFFNPKNAYVITIYFILLFYSFPSLLIYLNFGDSYFIQLFFITVLGVFGLFIGSNLRFLDGFFIKNKIKINVTNFINLLTFVFIIDIVLMIYLRPDIPLFSALFSGASQETLSAQRGYLKTATGLAFYVSYLNGILLSSFIPLCIGLSYFYNLKIKKILVIIYILFAILFLQKSLFIFAILPILVALKIKGELKIGKILFIFIFIFSLLNFLTNLAIDNNNYVYEDAQTILDFYSSQYKTSGSIDFLVWRSLGVPVATAIDSLKAFDMVLSNQNLFGATSSIVALIFGLERYNFEQLVHAYQYGDVSFISEEVIGRANSIYLIDSYVNFSWPGVFIISILIGLIYRGFWKSSEKAWAVLWLLFLMQITSVGFIGIMLSGGYIFIIILMLNIEFANVKKYF